MELAWHRLSAPQEDAHVSTEPVTHSLTIDQLESFQLNQNKCSDPRDKPRLAIGVSDFSTPEPLLNAEKIISNGMNFIEPGLAKIAAMPSADFAVAAERIQNNGSRVQSVNWLLPLQLKVTGPDVDEVKTRHFLESALARTEKLGAKAVVFGSPGSRSLPEGSS